MTQLSSGDARPIVIVGGGNAGISIAARLRRRGLENLIVVEPRDEHVYAPLQSHIAGGVASRRRVVRRQADVTPRGVTWIRARVERVRPDASVVALSTGVRIEYRHLIIAAGIEQHWRGVPGLEEGLTSPSLVSNYTLELAEKASSALAGVTTGTVVFTQAPEPASCAGIAQKPMYLACDRWRSRGELEGIRVVFITPQAHAFHIPEVAAELSRALERYGIETLYETQVVEVRADRRELDVEHDGQRSTIAYDVLHAAPPQAAAGWIAESGLSDADGFVDVSAETLRHRRWDNVWALGDAAPVTTVRSGGAIRSQSQIITDLQSTGETSKPYDGYTETPFTVSRHTAVFAEFDRTGRLTPTIPFWRTLYRERRFTYVMDRWVLPWVYWNLILKGRA